MEMEKNTSKNSEKIEYAKKKKDLISRFVGSSKSKAPWTPRPVIIIGSTCFPSLWGFFSTASIILYVQPFHAGVCGRFAVNKFSVPQGSPFFYIRNNRTAWSNTGRCIQSWDGSRSYILISCLKNWLVNIRLIIASWKEVKERTSSCT